MQRLLFAVATFSALVAAQTGLRDNDDDLERYVSRPDIRPPKMLVETHDRSAVSSGYWFVAPYSSLATKKPTTIYQSRQIGPHIYDGNGDLVWSGADVFPDRNVFDFRLSEAGIQSNMTFLLAADEHDNKHITGAGVILDDTYTPNTFVKVNRGQHVTNMHEFVLVDGGKSALTFCHDRRLLETESPPYRGWVIDLGFLEIDVAKSKVNFEWWATEHVHPSLSTVEHSSITETSGWDYFHINSADKDENGDYLISARFMDAIYKISGVDGSIIWQLGGKKSSFEMVDFNFSAQHDARFRGREGGRTIISFLDNGSDGKQKTANVSSAMIVSLDESSMTARLVKRYDRPDGGITSLRGNVQVLPNSNVFVGWSENSKMTEFTPDGKEVQSARFASSRFATYRSYKFDYWATPRQGPDIVCNSYGTSSISAHTACYVSWNGATDVVAWRFYAVKSSVESALIGSASRTGFETMFIYEGCYSLVFAEAVDVNGQGLRNSSDAVVVTPGTYKCSRLGVIGKENPAATNRTYGNNVDPARTTPDMSHPHNPEASSGDVRLLLHKMTSEPSQLGLMTFCIFLGAFAMLVARHATPMMRMLVGRRKFTKGGRTPVAFHQGQLLVLTTEDQEP